MPLWQWLLHLAWTLGPHDDGRRFILAAQQADDMRFVAWSATPPRDGAGTRVRVEAMPIDGGPPLVEQLRRPHAVTPMPHGLVMRSTSAPATLGVVDARGFHWVDPSQDIAADEVVAGNGFLISSGRSSVRSSRYLQRWDLVPGDPPRAAWSIWTAGGSSLIVAGDKAVYRENDGFAVASIATGEHLWHQRVGEELHLESAGGGMFRVVTPSGALRIDAMAPPAESRLVHLSIRVTGELPRSRDLGIGHELASLDDKGRAEVDVAGRGMLRITGSCLEPLLVPMDGPAKRRVVMQRRPECSDRSE